MQESIEQKKKMDELNELIFQILNVNQIFMKLIIRKIRNKTTDTTTTSQKLNTLWKNNLLFIPFIIHFNEMMFFHEINRKSAQNQVIFWRLFRDILFRYPLILSNLLLSNG